MKNGDDIIRFISTIHTLCEQLRSMNAQCTQIDEIQWLCNSLDNIPDLHNAIELIYIQDLNDLQLDKVKNILINSYTRAREKANNNNLTSFASDDNNNNTSNLFHEQNKSFDSNKQSSNTDNNKYKNKNNSSKNYQSNSSSGPIITCTRCKYRGHTCEDCHTDMNSTKYINNMKNKNKWQQQQSQNTNNSNNSSSNNINKYSALATNSEEQSHHALVVNTEPTFIKPHLAHKSTHSHKLNIIDSGTTMHIVADDSIISNINNVNVPINIKIANGDNIQINQTETMNLGNSIVLNNVAVNNQLSANLFSVAKFTDNGATWIFNKDEAVLAIKPKIELDTMNCMREVP